MTISLKVNGASHTVDVEPSTPLLYVLRNDLGLQGPHFGCEVIANQVQVGGRRFRRVHGRLRWW